MGKIFIRITLKISDNIGQTNETKRFELMNTNIFSVIVSLIG